MKPKLTLRDLFWLTLVVALAFGWYMDRKDVAKIKERNRVLENWLSFAELVGFSFDRTWEGGSEMWHITYPKQPLATDPDEPSQGEKNSTTSSIP